METKAGNHIEEAMRLSGSAWDAQFLSADLENVLGLILLVIDAMEDADAKACARHIGYIDTLANYGAKLASQQSECIGSLWLAASKLEAQLP